MTIKWAKISEEYAKLKKGAKMTKTGKQWVKMSKTGKEWATNQ